MNRQYMIMYFQNGNVFELWQTLNNFTTAKLTQTIRELPPQDVNKKGDKLQAAHRQSCGV